MPRCIYKKCVHMTGQKSTYPDVSLHKLPKHPQKIRSWLQNAGMEEEQICSFIPMILEDHRGDKFRMCSNHFSLDSYIVKGTRRCLREDAEPTLFKKIWTDAGSPFDKWKRRTAKRKSAQSSSGIPAVGTAKQPCGSCHLPINRTTTVHASTQIEPEYFNRSLEEEPQLLEAVCRSFCMDHPYNKEDEQEDLGPHLPQSSPKVKPTSGNHMTTSVMIEEEHGHTAERILNLTLEIICLMTGESLPAAKSGDQVIVTMPPPHCVSLKGQNDKKILEVIKKMIELLKVWQYIKRQKDLYKDSSMKNKPSLTSPDASSNRNPPERCTGPLYSQDCPQEDPTNPHHYQDEVVKVEVKVEEEEEMYVMSGQQSMEEGDMIRTVKKEEEETYLRGDQQSMEEGDMMGTIKKEEETYVRSDQQFMEEGDIMGTSKEKEEETYVRSDQRSVEEGDMMGTSKEEEEETYVGSDQRSVEEGDIMGAIKQDHTATFITAAHSPGIRSPSETCLTSSPYCTMDDDITEDSSEETPAFQPGHACHPSPGGAHVRSQLQKRFPCMECGKCFKQKTHLTTHLRSHTGEKPFPCSECEKCFMRKDHLTDHKRSHTGEKPHSCTECGKCFAYKPSLAAHQRSHRVEKSYECAECGKTFRHKQNLQQHLRSHTQEKPHSCTECGKYFAYKSRLAEHQKSHTNEQSYDCAECGKTFRHKRNLDQHQRFHTSEKPHLCTECGKCFAYKSRLVTHQRAHTGEQNVGSDI